MKHKKNNTKTLRKNFVTSLLEIMQEGHEYESIVNFLIPDDQLLAEQRRALSKIEQIRGRKCICYIGNRSRPSERSSIRHEDDLPFNEMISSVPAHEKTIDVLLATGGGSLEQVVRFVETLRSRFNNVSFIIPEGAMSAGTVFSLSGDEILMDERSYLGPIDPQVQTKDSYVPAQSILALLKQIQAVGQEELAKGNNPPWSLVRLLDNMDHRQIAVAMSQTQYSQSMATRYLSQYKFRHWETHSKTGTPVSQAEKDQRATTIAELLASHEAWKMHGHAISRTEVENTLKLKVTRTESIPGLALALRRFWALTYYIFDRSDCAKVFLSQDYFLVFNKITV